MKKSPVVFSALVCVALGSVACSGTNESQQHPAPTASSDIQTTDTRLVSAVYDALRAGAFDDVNAAAIRASRARMRARHPDLPLGAVDDGALAGYLRELRARAGAMSLAEFDASLKGDEGRGAAFAAAPNPVASRDVLGGRGNALTEQPAAQPGSLRPRMEEDYCVTIAVSWLECKWLGTGGHPLSYWDAIWDSLC